MLNFTCKFRNWYSSDLNLFVGSKVNYVGQRSNEGKCNNLSVSSIALHPSACLKPDLDDRCLLVILIFLRRQRWARHITAITLLWLITFNP